MLIPWWLPWAVVLALALPFLLEAMTDRAPEGTDPERPPPVRAPRAGGSSRPWTWSALAVSLVVAVSLTVDRVHVGEGELYDAVDAAAGSVDGTSAEGVDERVRVEVGDRLGRAVDVELVEVPDGTSDTGSDQSYYEVRLADHDGGPVACLDVLGAGGTVTSPGYAMVSASRGGCES